MRKLQSFGFTEPAFADSPEGIRTRRDAMVFVAIILLSLGAVVTVFLLGLATCGPFGQNDSSCPWAVPQSVALFVPAVVLLVAFLWFHGTYPSKLPGTRPPTIGGSWAAAEALSPRREVLFDPSYGRRPPP